MSEHIAIGPPGENLLGFLATMGTFRTLTEIRPSSDVRMRWQLLPQGWRPAWHVAPDVSQEALVEALHEYLSARDGAPEFTALGNSLPVEGPAFAAFARQAADAAGATDRRLADFALAYGCELVTNDNGRIQDTALRTVGAGQQRFFDMIGKLVRGTKPEHIRQALFEVWRYRDPSPAMRWDPADDRRYAYRADDPKDSKEFPIRTERGANRLAIEALPFFPTAIVGRMLFTASFVRNERGWATRWPIWEPAIPLDVARSLMTHPELGRERPDPRRLHALGVVEVFESLRSTEDRYRNFSAARALLGAGPREVVAV
ncbi:type I-G CRISPR-associated protein, Cas3-extension family [Limnochorda pilosa]|uniref:Uncharacterized protein n=1 Tax=Limnochorda pilosa TaxID=1555112 RepID=A0A0K2SG72_LIMPI|nr:hypothetical protein [Limnochorda pilosa]BAS26090.1 hypothetical protein LIP_0233 [Limnochorda pilosa]